VSEAYPTLTDLTVLIVDDDDVDRMAVCRALTAGGVDAVTIEAADATSALQLLASQKIDCVFFDFNMPGNDGLWLVQQARGRGLRTPLIVLTGQGDERTAVELMKAGASDYFSKASVTPERVVSAVRQSLRVVRMESALRQSEQQARLAVEATELGTWELHPASGSLELSDRCRFLLGMTPEEPASYERFLEGLHPDDRDRTHATVLHALDPASGGAYDIEYRTVSSAEGRQLWVRAMGRAVFDETGRATRFIGTVQDIGDRKQLEGQRARLLDAERMAREQAEAASRVREDLLAIVSHDLRNPLSAISMSAEALRLVIPADLAKTCSKQLETIARSTRRMDRLISDLLDVASIDAGGMALQTETHEVYGLLRDAVEMFWPMAADKSLLLELNAVAPGLRVLVDKDRVMQVFSNLIGNAVKFTREGGRVTLNARGDGRWVRISVADTGQGVSAEQMPHLFDRYWQAKQHGRLGIGLGLSIAKGIVEAHGGAIEAQSAPGKGTTFQFTLPRAE
jgi:PAS domain S-box-containing protein